MERIKYPQKDLIWTNMNRGVTKWPCGSLPRWIKTSLPDNQYIFIRPWNPIFLFIENMQVGQLVNSNFDQKKREATCGEDPSPRAVQAHLRRGVHLNCSFPFGNWELLASAFCGAEAHAAYVLYLTGRAHFPTYLICVCVCWLFKFFF
jgi:hypothetical protein